MATGAKKVVFDFSAASMSTVKTRRDVVNISMPKPCPGRKKRVSASLRIPTSSRRASSAMAASASSEIRSYR